MARRAIWKYPLALRDVQGIDMPSGANILCVQVQAGVPCLWAIVDTEARNVMRRIRIVGTGHPIEVEGEPYIGTFQIHDGALVFHAFEVLP